MNERDGLTTAVRKHIKSLGRAVKMEKRWGGGIYGTPGVADWVGVAYGFPVAIETKHPNGKGKLSAEQIAWRDEWMDAGGLYLEALHIEQIRWLFDQLAAANGKGASEALRRLLSHVAPRLVEGGDQERVPPR